MIVASKSSVASMTLFVPLSDNPGAGPFVVLGIIAPTDHAPCPM